MHLSQNEITIQITIQFDYAFSMLILVLISIFGINCNGYRQISK